MSKVTQPKKLFIAYTLTKNYERCTIGELRAEPNERVYGRVDVFEADDLHREQTQTQLQVTDNRTDRTQYSSKQRPHLDYPSPLKEAGW